MAPAVAVWLGLACGAGLGAAAAVAVMGTALVFAWLAVRAPDRVGTIALLAALALAALARAAGHEAWLARQREWILDPDRTWRVEARVTEPPARESGEPDAVVAVSSATPPLLAGTRLRLRLPAEAPAEWGDRVWLLARLDLPPTLRNPGGFDARAAADAAGLAGAGRAFVCRVAPSRGLRGWPRASVARWRRALEECLDTHLSPPARELVTPLVVGDRSALSPDLNAAFRASGLVHLLALSGLHVTWLAALARGLCASLGGGLTARSVAAALCAAAYAGIAGPLPSLMRAAATELIAALARLRGRALDPIQALAVSALVLLAAAPGWAGDLGFQLSFAATLGLLAIGPWLAERAGRWRGVLSPLLPTLSAQVMALPVLLARFHAFSWTGAIANLIAVPISGLLLASAWIGAALEGIGPGLGSLLFSACEVLAAALRWIATCAGGTPGAMVSAGAAPLPVLLAGAGAALLALSLPETPSIAERGRPPSRARFAARLLGALSVALALGLVLLVHPLAPPPGRAWLVVLDVGQGDAIALGLPDGWWLVDAGPRSPRYDAGERVVVPFLRWAGVSRLAAIALTHDDGDHTGGAPAVARAVRVERWRAPPSLPGVPGPGPRFGAAPAARGDTLHRDPLIVALWPPRPRAAGVATGDSAAALPAPALTTADNAAGLVLEVGEGAGRALFLADVDSTVEESLAAAPGVAVLKVAHHGSASSSGAAFLAAARPALAVISVGRRNPFGHPSAAALARLAATGCRIERTDRAGAVWVELSSEGPRLVDWRRGIQRASTAETSRLRVEARARE